MTGLCLEAQADQQSLIPFRQLHATSALFFGLLALAASTIHLGRPLYAFRAILGIRHSWLSREIIAFGAFAASAMIFAAACWLKPQHWAVDLLEIVVAASGAAGVFSSVMIYVVTGREFWSFGWTAAKFVLTSAVLGIATTWFLILLFAVFIDNSAANLLSESVSPTLVKALIAASVAKLLLEVSVFRFLFARRNSPLKRSAQLLSLIHI